MSCMYEGPYYKAKDGKIYFFIEGESYCDVDWGMTHTPDRWVYICEDTPENRKERNLVPYHTNSNGEVYLEEV